MAKVLITTTSVGPSGEEEAFEKPWSLTLLMFVGMSISLLFDKGVRRRCRCGRPADRLRRVQGDGLEMEPSAEARRPGRQTPEAPAERGVREPKWRRSVAMTSVPAAFHLLATGLSLMGLLYVPVSVWQLIRGVDVVFAEVLGVLFLGRGSLCFRWLGVALCGVGVATVGLSSLLASKGYGGEDQEVELFLFGIGLVLASQAVRASMLIAEEHLLKRCDLPPLQVVGFEGVWGGLIMIPLLAVFFFAPGSDHGRFEDVSDAGAQLAGSGELFTFMLIYMLSCFASNIAGIQVTGALSSVHRAMLDVLRAAFLWGYALEVHGVRPDSKLGEAWTEYSPLELAGFIMIILGHLVYGTVLRVPGIRYPPSLEEQEEAKEAKAAPTPGGVAQSPGVGENPRSPGGRSGQAGPPPVAFVVPAVR